VRAFHVRPKRPNDQGAIRSSSWRSFAKTALSHTRWRLAGALGLILAVAVVLLVALPRSSIDKSQPPLLSVAVLPLTD
jgi:hypothetical protein